MKGQESSRQNVPFNPGMLRWAREARRVSLAEAADHVGKAVEKVQAWEEEGSGVTPTVRQARKLADLYGRPFLEFFLPDPPELPKAGDVPDYRLHADAPNPKESRELVELAAWAETQRLNALDLYEILGDEPPEFPPSLSATLETSADGAAQQARDAIGFPIAEQLAMQAKDRDRLASILRRRLETVGVMTVKRSELARYRARGLCIAVFPLPVIMFTGEMPGAQAFTLAHEFGHVLLRQSAISGPMERRGRTGRVRAVEEWCDRFAAAFLMPANQLLGVFPKPDVPRSAIDDDTLANLAKRFNVSQHAMLVRLVSLGYVEAEYYWKTKRPLFLKKEEEFTSFARPTYYGSRYRSRQDDLYTALVIDAWSSGSIGAHSAAEFMDIKSTNHLSEIRDNFGG